MIQCKDDDGNPKNYSFFVHDNGFPEDNISVIVWPNSTKGDCDWELQWQHEDFDQGMEATYIYIGEKNLSKAKIHDLLIKIGLNFDEEAAKNNLPHGYIPPTKLNNANKITTEYLVDLIVNKLSQKELIEIFQGNEGCGFDKPKNWKRGFKKKFKLEDYSSALQDSACTYGMDDYYFIDPDPSPRMVCADQYFVTYDEDYVNNKGNTVVAREFWHKVEDAQVLFLTDATDTRIVALAYHID
jgi:hypothetical protein